MTDDDLSPEQREVRRLLADARHDEPVPETVVARLDRVLAGLADEPVRVAPVTALATRRRRATSLLLAAAAVVAIGVGVSQVVDTGDGSADSLSSADRDAGGEANDAEEPGAAAPEADEPAEGAEDEQGTSATADSLKLAELSRSAYSDDVDALRSQAAGDTAQLDASSAFAAVGATCLSDTWGAGTFVPVRYDGIPAVVVFRRVAGDTQVADLFRCGDTEPHRSVTLPAP